MKSASTRFEKLPALAAMSRACSAEKACAGLVSMAPAMNMPMFCRASSSSVCVSSQRRNEISSSSFARGCAHGRSGSISATSASIRSMRPTISFSVEGGDREDLALERAALAVLAEVDVDALAVAAVGLEAEVVERVDERILVGRDPLAADLEGRPVDVVGPEAAADAVARFEHGDGQAGLLQFASRR